jgi:hypothetical protein
MFQVRVDDDLALPHHGDEAVGLTHVPLMRPEGRKGQKRARRLWHQQCRAVQRAGQRG